MVTFFNAYKHYFAIYVEFAAFIYRLNKYIIEIFLTIC